MIIGDTKHLIWIYNRMIDVHGENENIDYMRRFSDIIDIICNPDEKKIEVGMDLPIIQGITAQEAIDNMNSSLSEWAMLDIGCIPSDFFASNMYRLQRSVTVEDHDCIGRVSTRQQWVEQDFSKTEIIERMLEHGELWRYKIKPLRPMEITQGAFERLCQFDDHVEESMLYDGREVIIID